MKTLLTIITCTLMVFKVSAEEITNSGFEAWEGGVPANWFTSNLLNIYVPITQSTDAHSGSFAVHGVVLQTPNGTGYSPILSAGLDAKGFPVTFRPDALHGWYKFNSDSGDAFSVTVVVVKDNKAIGSGGYFSSDIHSEYTEFRADITYNSSEIPDIVQIVILITNNSKLHAGSSFVLDDLSFGSATDVVKNTISPDKFSVEQNFPNPFNPSSKIQFEIPEMSFVSVKVFNLLGEEVATIVSEQLNKGKHIAEFNSNNLSSGTYFYKIQAGSFSKTMKMIVLK